MNMIMLPSPVLPCEGKNATANSDADTVSTVESPTSSIEKQLSSCSISSSSASEKDRTMISTPAPPLSSTPQRRSIFSSYWRKASSSFKEDEDGSTPGASSREQHVKRSAKYFEPSYLGVYSFAPPSPLLTPKPAPTLSPISSSDSLTGTPSSAPPRPKSILRKHRSQSIHSPLQDGLARPGIISNERRPRSVSCIGPESGTRSQFDINPPPFLDDLMEVPSLPMRDAELKRQHSFVHFDPTITVRECIEEEEPVDESKESNWFSENELRSFMAETVNLCHASAVTAVRTYSLPSVKKAYETAHELGVKSPVLSTTHPDYARALYAEPVLHATDEDAIVHDGSKRFFKIVAKEMRRVLIVDSSPSTLKLFHRHVLSMFPHVKIDTAMSGEDALDKIDVDNPKQAYDMIIVEERLEQREEVDDVSKALDLTGSELLRLINEMEMTSATVKQMTGGSTDKTSSSRNTSPRRSLKIGVSVSLGEDCESLRNKGGADLFWSKPPPKPSNVLRNQVMNALLSKREKSVFICGC